MAISDQIEPTNRRKPATGKKGPDSYGASRYNRLTWGVMIDGILPSLGPERCAYRRSCSRLRCFQKEGILQRCCPAGRPCPDEEECYRSFVRSALHEHVRALEWLEPETFRRTIHDAAIASLQRMRLSARTAEEGFTRHVRGPNGERWLKEGLASGRYSVAIDRKWDDAMRRLLIDPREPTPDYMSW
jgi:hypothetical protein